MMDKYLIATEKIKKYEQKHLLKYYDKLNTEERENLLEDIINTDFEQIQELYKNIEKENKNKEDRIEPIEYINKEKLSLEEQKYYIEIGKETIKNGEYAVVTMAGGQRNETRA